MKTKISFLIIVLFTIKCQIGQINPCPSLWDILDDGYSLVRGEKNLDEFGIVNNISFLTKVNYYPPIKSFPKYCSGSISEKTNSRI